MQGNGNGNTLKAQVRDSRRKALYRQLAESYLEELEELARGLQAEDPGTLTFAEALEGTYEMYLDDGEMPWAGEQDAAFAELFREKYPEGE